MTSTAGDSDPRGTRFPVFAAAATAGRAGTESPHSSTSFGPHQDSSQDSSKGKKDSFIVIITHRVALTSQGIDSRSLIQPGGLQLYPLLQTTEASPQHVLGPHSGKLNPLRGGKEMTGSFWARHGVRASFPFFFTESQLERT